MNNNTYFSQTTPIFHGKQCPEEGQIVGYSAIIDKLGFQVPIPYQITLVCNQNKNYETDDWKVLPKSYLPEDNAELTEIEALYKHLVFALKYEGVNLLIFRKLTQYYSSEQLTDLVNIEPTGQYSRRIWFLIEWITGKKLVMKRMILAEEEKSMCKIEQLIAINISWNSTQKKLETHIHGIRCIYE